MESINRRLENSQILYRAFKRLVCGVYSINPDISNTERILRILLHPKHVNSKGIRPSAFRTPPGKDEISVTRLDYSTPDFCKKYGKRKLENNRSKFLGFAILKASEIRDFLAEVIYSPKLDNLAHGDIKIGFIPEKGEELPSEYQFIVKKLATTARRYDDIDVSQKKWTGEFLN